MGFSNLRIPKLCEFCEKPFEAKKVTAKIITKTRVLFFIVTLLVLPRAATDGSLLRFPCHITLADT